MLAVSSPDIHIDNRAFNLIDHEHSFNKTSIADFQKYLSQRNTCRSVFASTRTYTTKQGKVSSTNINEHLFIPANRRSMWYTKYDNQLSRQIKEIKSGNISYGGSRQFLSSAIPPSLLVGGGGGGNIFQLGRGDLPTGMQQHARPALTE